VNNIEIAEMPDTKTVAFNNNPIFVQLIRIQ